MILCIDSGNTRIKWALHDGAHWHAQGAVAQSEREALVAIWAQLPKPDAIAIANVAGEAAAATMCRALAPTGVAPKFIAASAAAGGVCNGYERPEQLGVDRWCALVGARSLHRHACLVVGLGTATTIDTLKADGTFAGGLILPGFDLMRGALARGTAQLPLAEGDWQAWPRNTDDAIRSGCLEAQAGAIERAFARIADEPEACCLLFGGVAPLLAPRLRVPQRLCEQLVLTGLLELA